MRGWLDEVEGYWSDQLAAFKSTWSAASSRRARAERSPREALGPARATTFVAVDPADAFEVFTSEIDQWWGRGPRFRFGKQRREH